MFQKQIGEFSVHKIFSRIVVVLQLHLKNGITLHIDDKNLSIPYSKTNNLPTFHAKMNNETNMCVTEDINTNLSTTQKKFLGFFGLDI
jgi:hypothetical protein